jgi:hypothetical protein
MMLSQVQRDILAMLDDDNMVPLEQIIMDMRRGKPDLPVLDCLDHIRHLSQASLVTIMQEPIPTFGQTFPSRLIEPESSDEVLGDLADAFDAFRTLGDYVRKEVTCARREPAGVPFGIYLVITENGCRERENFSYEQ